jgi:hypothetical protein
MFCGVRRPSAPSDRFAVHSARHPNLLVDIGQCGQVSNVAGPGSVVQLHLGNVPVEGRTRSCLSHERLRFHSVDRSSSCSPLVCDGVIFPPKTWVVEVSESRKKREFVYLVGAWSRARRMSGRMLEDRIPAASRTGASARAKGPPSVFPGCLPVAE